MTARRVRVGWFPVLLVVSVLLFAELLVRRQVGDLLGDFRAFYCAGSVLAHGANPYADAPIYACERTPQPFGLYHALPGVAVPAPLPGYALAGFALLSVLPYPVAAVLCLGALVAASVVSVVVVARVTRAPAPLVACALMLPLVVISIPYGEIVPVVILALACAAWALQRGRPWLAAVAIAVSTIEPNVALGAVLASFLCVPRVRVPLVVVLAATAGLWALAGGPALAISYMTHVLPTHALAEVARGSQFSTSWIVHSLGAPDRVAVICGELWYAAMLVAGLFAARALVRRCGDDAFAVLTAPAFVVLGGTFVHLAQITVALAFSLMVYVRAQGRTRDVIAVAIVLLAVPWLRLETEPQIVVLAVTTLLLLVAQLYDSWVLAWRLTLGAAVFMAFSVWLNRVESAAALHAFTAAPDPASTSWSAYVRASESGAAFALWLGKLPTWCGLVLACGGAYGSARPDGVAGVTVEHAPTGR